MSFLFCAIILAAVAILIDQVPENNWVKSLYWAFYIAVAAASSLGTIGIVTVFFK